VNFNNSSLYGNGCTTHNNTIDALPQPVLALIDGMSAAGVQDDDLIIYDASAQVGRLIPDYFRVPISNAYPGVSYIGLNQCSVTGVSYGADSSLTVTFPGTNIQDRLLADILSQVTFLINIPMEATQPSR
jgi:hypothetical protein